jgi:hypothetical protein
LPGLGTATVSSTDVGFRRRVLRGALVAVLFGLALTFALHSKAAAVGTTAASDTTASAPSTESTVTLEPSPESEVPAIPEPAPSAEPQSPGTPEPAPSAESQVPAIPEPAPSPESEVPAPAIPEPAPRADPKEPATPEPAPRADPQEPATPEPAPSAEPQSALATAPTATDPASIVTQTEAESPPFARAVRPAPRRPATPSAAGPWRAAASPLPFALPPYVDVSSLPALAPSVSSRGPAGAASDPTKRRRAEGADVERGPHSPLGPLHGTFHAASSATSGGGAAPDLFWCTILLGLAVYCPQALRRHRVPQLARRLVGVASLHEQPG